MSYAHNGQSPHDRPLPSEPFAGSAAAAPRRSAHPGWPARILFWAAVLVGSLPALVVAPLMSGGATGETGTTGATLVGLFALANVLGALLRLVLGVVAMLLARNTTWTRRLIAAGLYLCACAMLMVLTPLVPLIFSQVAGSNMPSVATMTIIQSLLSMIFLALEFMAWNIVRNRRWPLLLAAVVYAAAVTGANYLLSADRTASMPSRVETGVLIQAGFVLLIFLGLGLFHLLGRIRGATVAPPAQHPQGQGWDPLNSHEQADSYGQSTSYRQAPVFDQPSSYEQHSDTDVPSPSSPSAPGHSEQQTGGPGNR